MFQFRVTDPWFHGMFDVFLASDFPISNHRRLHFQFLFRLTWAFPSKHTFRLYFESASSIAFIHTLSLSLCLYFICSKRLITHIFYLRALRSINWILLCSNRKNRIFLFVGINSRKNVVCVSLCACVCFMFRMSIVSSSNIYANLLGGTKKLKHSKMHATSICDAFSNVFRIQLRYMKTHSLLPLFWEKKSTSENSIGRNSWNSNGICRMDIW